MGTSFHDQHGWRTNGHSTKQANVARQNASAGPGHPVSCGAFTKNPLVLQSAADEKTFVLHGAGAMPAWQGRLSTRETDAVVAYTRTQLGR